MCQYRYPSRYYNDFLQEQRNNPRYEGERGRVLGGPYDGMTRRQVEDQKQKESKQRARRAASEERKVAKQYWEAEAAKASVATAKMHNPNQSGNFHKSLRARTWLLARDRTE